MAEKKATLMVIKVDLDCEKCCKKIKKVLGKIPEIQNQIYDEKANTVTVTVFSCCPEKIKRKICCKGGETIKGIEIKAPEKPKPQDQKPKLEVKPDKPKDQKPDKPKDIKPDKPADPKPDKPKDQKPDKPKDPKPDKPVVIIAEPQKPKAEPKPPSKTPPEPVPAQPLPVRPCCWECYEGYGGGPCYQGFPSYGMPVPCYEPYGRPVCDSWGGGGYGYGYAGCRRGCYVGRCDCLSEDTSPSCSVM